MSITIIPNQSGNTGPIRIDMDDPRLYGFDGEGRSWELPPVAPTPKPREHVVSPLYMG
jgi:hypothetical protein